MSQAAGIGSLLPLVDTMKNLPDELLPDSFDRSEAEAMSSQMSAVHDLAQHLANAPVPCIFSPAGAPRYKFYADLARDGIQGALPDLEGEATVLAKLNRKVAKGKPETVGQPDRGYT